MQIGRHLGLTSRRSQPDNAGGSAHRFGTELRSLTVGNEVVNTAEFIGWNYRQLAAAFIVGLTFQLLLLPCLWPIGRAKMGLAFAFDAIMAARILVAYHKKE